MGRVEERRGWASSWDSIARRHAAALRSAVPCGGRCVCAVVASWLGGTGCERQDAEKDTLGLRSVLELFGSLLRATATHPEICFYMSFLCRFMHKPKLEHYETGLAVLLYLYHVKDIGLYYGLRSAMLEVYKDATWNCHPRDYCGHAILFCGAAISFGSQLMKIAAQLSGEAEIYAYVLAAKDLRFLQQVLECLGITLNLSTPIFTDSTTAQSWIKNPGATARSRHYEKFIMYVREQ